MKISTILLIAINPECSMCSFSFVVTSLSFFFLVGYRHHMYTVLQFMWKQEKYKDTLYNLAEDVSSHIIGHLLVIV